VTFAHVCDNHQGPGPGHPFVAKVVDAIRGAKTPPSFVVFTGDNVEVGRTEHWQFLKPIVLDPLAGFELLFTTGNHETAWSGLEGKILYRRYTGAPLRHVREKDGILVVALDAAVHGQHEGWLGEEQLGWLDGVLAASTAPVKLVALHHMVFREAGDRYLGDEAALYDVIAKRGVSLVLCGHGHANELWRYRETPVVMTGSAYAKGFSVFTVSGRAISVVFHAFDASGSLTAAAPAAIRDEAGALATGIKVMNEGELSRQTAPVLPKGVRLKWTRTLGGEILGEPAFAKRRVYVTAGDAGLFCLDAKSGRTVWTVTLAGFAMCRPVLAAGLVVAGSEGGVLAAFRAWDGKPAWSVTAGGAIAAAPAVVGGTLLFGSGDGVVHAVSVAGAVLAEARTSGNISVEPAVRGSLAYVTSWAGDLVALDGSCRVAWSRSFPEMIYSGPGRNAPCVAGDMLVIATGKPALLGFGAATGASVWETAEKVSYSSPVRWDGDVVCQTTGGKVGAFRATDGKLLFGIPGPSSSYTARVGVSGDRAYAAAQDGSLRAVDLWTRKALWTAQLSADLVTGSPAAAGHTVLVGTLGGALFALEDGR